MAAKSICFEFCVCVCSAEPSQKQVYTSERIYQTDTMCTDDVKQVKVSHMTWVSL